MHFHHALVAAAALPLVSAQLNRLAKEAGKLYFGTATDNPELVNSTYVSILTDTEEFGQLTPGNGMKVSFISGLRFLRRGDMELMNRIVAIRRA
jgi:endo-1,4-beta-xylanase